MVSEVSLGLNQCRINFGTGLDCIEPARLLITARKPYLHKYRQKLDTALASTKIMQIFRISRFSNARLNDAVGFLFSHQNNPPGGTVKMQIVKNICWQMQLTIETS